ncbi:BQ5605_C014g07453 [Microbotryum silenes-dioicae]|uniref:BQ5605_C014g07453 protein n=1 Tax=Microbotryum silenes-dioicae TaxID=796604 RepID=A0A2X0LXK8_9BASI|nr:BQ5605_C014g07453 [Microbotryum silenes-dioicae]
MYLIYGRRAVSIVVSPLNALSNHPAANHNRKGKKAVVVSEEAWRDGELYRQLRRPQSHDLLHSDCMCRLTSCLSEVHMC